MARGLARGKGKEPAEETEIVRISQRGTLTLPKKVRQGLAPDQIFEVNRREDGVIELRPRILVDQSQAWFWSAKWQAMEREADEDIAAGRVRQFSSAEDLFADLDAAEPG
ncbi:MAG TPA: AbrB/MazE/SpoVT family DNA-binding domain-containing protein [Chloroflexota bacterium]|nr:AbrB/MazE/SpoVT family DNA-binding domain-containing protein [Chloroflexota bacterium]